MVDEVVASEDASSWSLRDGKMDLERVDLTMSSLGTRKSSRLTDHRSERMLSVSKITAADGRAICICGVVTRALFLQQGF